MSSVSDLSAGELKALAKVVKLYEEIFNELSAFEAFPDGVMHIKTELVPGYLGWVGHNENGDIVFQPAPPQNRLQEVMF